MAVCWLDLSWRHLWSFCLDIKLMVLESKSGSEKIYVILDLFCLQSLTWKSPNTAVAAFAMSWTGHSLVGARCTILT